MTINELVSIVEGIAGVTLERRYNLDAPQGVRGRNSDNNRLREVLGWEPGIHLREDCVVDGRFDLRRNGWLARMGYRDYAIVTDLFEMERPA